MFITQDQLNVLLAAEFHPGAPLKLPNGARFSVVLKDGAGRSRTRDGAPLTADSTGAFLVGELERLDQTLHMPLVNFTYGRDLKQRADVTPADEVSSFTVSSFGSTGGLGTGNGIGTGKSWVSKEATQITNASVDIGKVSQPMTVWAHEVKWTIPELMSAAMLGRPIDEQKIAALKMKRDMDLDEQAYFGDSGLNVFGLLKLDNRTDFAAVSNVGSVATGASGSTAWSKKQPDEILADVNALLVSVWEASGFAVMPDTLLIPPVQFGYLSSTKISQAGSMSVLRFLLENNIALTQAGVKLDIYPTKWALGAGAGGTIGTSGTVDRMCAYTNDDMRVRFPFCALQTTPLQYDGLYHKQTFWTRIGVVEPVYPETIGYADGI